jgi:hypothetical protein
MALVNKCKVVLTCNVRYAEFMVHTIKYLASDGSIRSSETVTWTAAMLLEHKAYLSSDVL